MSTLFEIESIISSSQSVMTHGVNWQAVGVILGGIATIVLPVAALLGRLLVKNAKKNDLRNTEIIEAVQGVSDVSGKVLRPGVVTQLDMLGERMTKVEAQVSSLAGTVQGLDGRMAIFKSLQEQGALERREARGETNSTLRRLSHDVSNARMAIALMAEDTNQQRKRVNAWTAELNPEKPLDLSNTPVPGLASFTNDEDD